MAKFHLIQSQLAWQDPAANREMFSNKMSGLDAGLIVLPEMFSTGFTMASAALAEPMDGVTATWLMRTAQARSQPVCGSMIISDNNRYYNRFIWCDETGEPSFYDKRHLFRMADEHQFYQPGETRLVIQYDNFRVLPQICYDLRFPVWSRNQGDYDAMLFVANWPAARQQQWLTLLRARAIENLCYVIAVNRVGEDGNGVSYLGGSCVIGPDGEYLVAPIDGEQVVSIDLGIDALNDYRLGFPAYLDSDAFELSHQH